MTSLQCVKAFSPAQLSEEQNHEGYGPQSGQYLHSWGGAIAKPIQVEEMEERHRITFCNNKKCMTIKDVT